MPDIVPPLIAAAAILGGIWLKAYLDHIGERKVFAAVAFAQLEDAINQLQLANGLLEIIGKYVDKERVKELRGNEEARQKAVEDLRPRLERVTKEFELRRELARETGVKFILQVSPAAVGRLGPVLAYFVTSLYTRITSAQTNFVVMWVTLDLDSIIQALEGEGTFQIEFKAIKERWDFLRPMLLQATGVQLATRR